jgi:predicted PurR-regulated permease PerM
MERHDMPLKPQDLGVNGRDTPTSGVSLAAPFSGPERPLRRIANWAIIGIFLMMFGGILYFARAVLVPVVAAALIGTTLAPLSRRAARHHIPPWLFACLAIGVLVAILQASTFLFSAPVAKWIERAPELGNAIRDRIHAFESALHLPNLIPIDAGSGFKIDLGTFVEPFVGVLTPALSQLLIFLVTLFFFVISQAEMRRSLILFFAGQEARLRTIRLLNDVEEDLATYAATVTAINFGLGCITAVAVYFIGMPSPVLWGVFAFLCNYVPYVGPAAVVCVLAAVGLANFPTLGQALIAPAFYIALTTIEGHFITPNIVGQRFTLNPLAVFLSLVFWTWLWGPVGGFLATPILIIILTAFAQLFPEDDAILPE